jgi:hypothetical protein
LPCSRIKASPFREVHGVNPKPLVIGVRKSDSHGIASHDTPHARRDGVQQIAEIQIGDDRVVQVQ